MADTPKVTSDVAKPGTTPPPATSRPVIVGHGVPLQDPMVNADQPKPAVTEPKPTVAGSSRPKIQPTASATEIKQDATEEDDKKHAETNPVPEAVEEIDVQARLGELIESGDYNVSIKQKSSGGGAGTFVFTVLGIVLVAAIIVYLLADLKVIDLGIKLPFEIFK